MPGQANPSDFILSYAPEAIMRNTTVPSPLAASNQTSPDLDIDILSAPPKEALALVILWSAQEPERVGETALLFPPKNQWILGRSPDSISTPVRSGMSMGGRSPAQLGRYPSEQPLHFFRQRPPGSPDAETIDEAPRHLLGEAISRRQLQITDHGDVLFVQNIGKCQMAMNGQVVQSATVGSGDTLYLRGQLLLYCTRRNIHMEALRAYPAERVGSWGQPDTEGMIGESPMLWNLRERLAACARTGFHVLIVGESGSGKELAAQAIHNLSRRSGRKLVADNIAAIPPSLAAALLFGNKKNFPNPGMEERVGLIGAANESTLFLDEIGDMPEDVQPMFLRVAERKGEYFRLGDEGKLHRSDFRLVGATNRPERMRYELKRRFEREIRVPSLNNRKEDIPLLVRHMLNTYAVQDDIDAQRFFDGNRPRIHPRLIEQLVHHKYVTNVSEVAFLLGHAIAESPSDIICPPRSGFPIQASVRATSSDGKCQSKPPKRPAPLPLPAPIQAQRALDEQAGHIARAAVALGISRDQLNRMIRREHLVVKRTKAARP
jgi:DNA-binding NtrC family response regulator